MEALITIADARAKTTVSKNLNADTFAAFVANVQDISLQNLLGSALFYDLEQNIAEQKYVDLIDGVEYTDLNGQTVYFPGLKPYIIWQFAADYLIDGRVKHADIGSTTVDYTRFIPPNSSGAEMFERTRQNYLARAAHYANEIKKYLNSSTSKYPLWRGKAESKLNNFQYNVI